MQYDYTIAPEANVEIFKRQCATLENQGYSQTGQIIDVDGSVVRKYAANNGSNAEVWLDYYVDATYVKSDVSLENHIATL